MRLNLVTRRFWIVGLFCGVLTLPKISLAWDAGEFEGAVWTIQLTPRVNRNGGGLRATYRIADHVLYQKEKPRIPEYNQRVGKNYPNGSRTRTHFETLTAFGPQKERHTLSGWATLKFDARGEWSGQFIDSTGKHWDCTVKRVQE